MEDLKIKATEMAEKFGVCPIASESMLKGAIERVESALAKGEPLTIELCAEALLHYMASMQKYMDELKNNTNGAKDKLQERVLNELYAKHN
ncbi:hypothetical protein VCHA53O466_50061 [Vibrio chagasii]|nr:hypothetical protein VCHA53O466_50061 [Vibrio chagasii]